MNQMNLVPMSAHNVMELQSNNMPAISDEDNDIYRDEMNRIARIYESARKRKIPKQSLVDIENR